MAAVNRSVLHAYICMRGLPRIVLSLRLSFVTELSQRVKAGKIDDAVVFWERVRFWSKALHVELNIYSETSVEMLPLTSTGIVS